MTISSSNAAKLIISNYFDSIVREIDIEVEEQLAKIKRENDESEKSLAKTNPADEDNLNLARDQAIDQVRQAEKETFERYERTTRDELKFDEKLKTLDELEKAEYLKAKLFAYKSILYLPSKATDQSSIFMLICDFYLDSSQINYLKDVFLNESSCCCGRFGDAGKLILNKNTMMIRLIEKHIKTWIQHEPHQMLSVIKMSREQLDELYASQRLLDLTSLRIAEIQADAFDGLDRLSELKLMRVERNFPSAAHTTFSRGLLGKHLQKLVITHNRLEILDDRLFAPLAQLKHLCLRFNEIREIRAHAFAGLASSLVELDLRENQIRTIDNRVFTAARLTRLETLHLLNNQIDKIEPHAFAGLVNLRSLNVSLNKIATLSSSLFVGLTSLTQLDLGFNQIDLLPDRVFASLVALEDLNLERNRLVQLDANAFVGLDNLKRLNLNRNRLEALSSRGVFAPLGQLRKLSMHDNRLRAVPGGGVFDGLARLETLDLRWNQIRAIESGAFDGLESLRELDVSFNRIEVLSARSFVCLKRLKKLNLGEMGRAEAACGGDRFISEVDIFRIFSSVVTIV